MNVSLALALLFSFATAGLAETLEVPSEIEAVTVYQDLAKVTRAFAVNLPAGEKTTLQFSGLPEGINSAYVTVGVSAGVPLNLGLVSFDSEFRESERSQLLRDLEARQRELMHKVDVLQAERDALTALAASRMRLVDSLNAGLSERGNADLYELARGAYEDAAAVKKDCDEKAAALDSDIQTAKDAVTDATERVRKQREKEEAACAKYYVEAVSAGGLTKGTISYYVIDASWAPKYIVKADTNRGTLNLSYAVQIFQDSGEDWNNVSVTLETSRPGAGAKPVEPAPVYLKKVFGGRGKMVESARVDSDDVVLLLPFEVIPSGGSGSNTVSVSAANSVSANFISGMTGFRSQLPMRASVESGAGAVILPLTDREMACKFHTETIPFSAETAYLIATLKNGFDLPMLAGGMQAIVDGSTNGEGFVEETLPGEELILGLGVNQNVVVERTVVNETGGNSGIFGSKRVEKRSYVNRITNHMSITQRIVVRDLIPISKDDKIDVRLLEPKDAKVDPETGLFDQELTLKPGESVELPTKFNVSYPSDWKLSAEF